MSKDARPLRRLDLLSHAHQNDGDEYPPEVLSLREQEELLEEERARLQRALGAQRERQRGTAAAIQKFVAHTKAEGTPRQADDYLGLPPEGFATVSASLPPSHGEWVSPPPLERWQAQAKPSPPAFRILPSVSPGMLAASPQLKQNDECTPRAGGRVSPPPTPFSPLTSTPAETIEHWRRERSKLLDDLKHLEVKETRNKVKLVGLLSALNTEIRTSYTEALAACTSYNEASRYRDLVQAVRSHQGSSSGLSLPPVTLETPARWPDSRQLPGVDQPLASTSRTCQSGVNLKPTFQGSAAASSFFTPPREASTMAVTAVHTTQPTLPRGSAVNIAVSPNPFTSPSVEADANSSPYQVSPVSNHEYPDTPNFSDQEQDAEDASSLCNGGTATDVKARSNNPSLASFVFLPHTPVSTSRRPEQPNSGNPLRSVSDTPCPNPPSSPFSLHASEDMPSTTRQGVDLTSIEGVQQESMQTREDPCGSNDAPDNSDRHEIDLCLLRQRIERLRQKQEQRLLLSKHN